MRSGYVAVVGKANAGKSTLINVLVGEKVAIVSPKPQTTRNAILGVLNKSDYQIVFIDTPGIYKAKNKLSEKMSETAETYAQEGDFLLYVIDGHGGVKSGDIDLIKAYMCKKIPMAIAYTKIDIMPKEKILDDMKLFFESGIDLEVFPVSARKKQNLDKLEKFLSEQMPEGDAIMPENVISDKSEKFMISEIMREKILLNYGQEIPHGVAIVVNGFEKQPNGVYDINLDIVCEKQNHKAIIIGKQGSALKTVSMSARKEMEEFLGAKVFLTTYVKVKEDWRNRPNFIKEYLID